jgi:hypothetical protein
MRIDACIAPLVQALQAGGVNMRGSCCGHGTSEGHVHLEDGRVLLVLSREQAVRYFSDGIPAFPVSADLIAKNPDVDPQELEKALKTLKTLRDQGLQPSGYRLVSPFRRPQGTTQAPRAGAYARPMRTYGYRAVRVRVEREQAR